MHAYDKLDKHTRILHTPFTRFPSRNRMQGMSWQGSLAQSLEMCPPCRS